MATEYGYRDYTGDMWPEWTREETEAWCREIGLVLIARDISPTRIVSIRA